MTDNIFYPDMLKTFVECPQKYKLKYIDEIKMPQNSFLSEKGRKIHALANFYLKGQDILKLENSLSEDEKNIFDKLKQNPYFQKSYVKSEYNLTSKINGFWISGRLDALMKDNERYYILDYKTGSIPKNPKYDFQTMIYLLVLNKILNIDSLSFIYIDLKNNKNIEINFDNELKAEYTEAVSNVCKNIINFSSNTTNTSELCKYCEYKKLCYIN